jgi:hypothetical protein
VTLVDARTIAQRLGLPEDAVRAIQRHGYLQRLEVDDGEIRTRLWRCHVAFQETPARRHAAVRDR